MSESEDSLPSYLHNSYYRVSHNCLIRVRGDSQETVKKVITRYTAVNESKQVWTTQHTLNNIHALTGGVDCGVMVTAKK